jgi:3-oxoacyl-[acyl-carrier-protein] synthase II
LQDSILLLQEGEASTVLTGGIDELTDTSHALLSRFGIYRHTRAGEGAAFFLLSAGPSQIGQVRLEGMTTFYKPEDSSAIEHHIRSFLSAHDVSIDLLISGASGDPAGDAIYRQLATGSSPLAGLPVMTYKDLCGEYPTSTAFALWLATDLLKKGAQRRILIYNHYLGIHHSLILLSAGV